MGEVGYLVQICAISVLMQTAEKEIGNGYAFNLLTYTNEQIKCECTTAITREKCCIM